jgi:hypothetical protein
MKKLFSIIVLISVLLTACGPSQEQIQATVQASIAQTQAALPTITPIPPTATPTELPTSTPLPTLTPTITITPSLTPDVRVIDVDPRELLLQKTDLPVEGKYYLPGPGWISPVRNSEIVSAWTVADGQKYLAETGRIDGWLVYYKRGGSSGTLLPEQIYDNVTIFSTIEGAQLVITRYGDRRITEEDRTEIEVPQIGDVTRAFTKKEVDSGGGIRASIMISFSYRNIVHTVMIWGWETEVTMDNAIAVAETLLENLKQMPLSNIVTFTP